MNGNRRRNQGGNENNVQPGAGRMLRSRARNFGEDYDAPENYTNNFQPPIDSRRIGNRNQPVAGPRNFGHDYQVAANYANNFAPPRNSRHINNRNQAAGPRSPPIPEFQGAIVDDDISFANFQDGLFLISTPIKNNPRSRWLSGVGTIRISFTEDTVESTQ